MIYWPHLIKIGLTSNLPSILVLIFLIKFRKSVNWRDYYSLVLGACFGVLDYQLTLLKPQ